MYKVFAFLKRNTSLLSHDEYRAGHVGNHCGHSRRLKDIRGYLVNIWSNTDLQSKMGNIYTEITMNEPVGFTDYWDGFPEVYFDNRDSWTKAATPEPTRAMAEGLVIDPDWKLDDGPYLFDPVPGSKTEFKSYHLHMEEHVVIPVERPEFKLTKLIQFCRLNPELDAKPLMLKHYATLVSQLQDLRGYIINLRDPDMDAAIRDFYPADSWGFTADGIAHRREFCALWDTASELHFDSIQAFIAARSDSGLNEELQALERELFEALWYVEVDENLIVLPNRSPAPDYYHR
jgi:hypothetical protein